MNNKQLKSDFQYLYQYNIINYIICFFVKKFFVGNSKEKISVLLNKDFKYSNFTRFFVKKIFLYKKFFFFFLLKTHMRNLYFFIQKKIFFQKDKKSFSFGDLFIPDFTNKVKRQSFFFDTFHVDHFHNKRLLKFFRGSLDSISFFSDFDLKKYGFYSGDDLFILYFEFILVRFLTLKLNSFDDNKSNCGFFAVPTRSKTFTVLRSPHKHSKSREQFGFSVRKLGLFHENFMDIFQSGLYFDNNSFSNNFKIKCFRCIQN